MMRILLLSLLLIAIVLSSNAGASEQISATWRKAVQSNKLDSIRQYLKMVDNVDLPARNGKTALMAAAFMGDEALMTELVAEGASVNRHNDLQGSPLLYGAASGDPATVSLLLSNGADIDHQSTNGWNALMMAVAKNRVAVVDLLCQAGADLNAADVYGWTPLMRAAFEGREQIVAILLRQPSTDLERINDHGQRALHLAVGGKHPDTVALLLSAGARQEPDFAGHTPLSMATTLDHAEISRQLKSAASNQH